MIANRGDETRGEPDSRSTAPSPPAPRSTRSATSPRRSPSGTRRSASSAATAAWSAPTPSSASRPTSPSTPEERPRPSSAVDAKGKEFAGLKATLQVAPEDCTGCGACVNICPAKDKVNDGRKAINLEPRPPCARAEAENWEFFLAIPNTDTKSSTSPCPRASRCASPSSSSPEPARAAARPLTSSS